jgi:hypothetical protein
MENGFWVRSERDEQLRRLHKRNRQAEGGTGPASRAQLEEWAASFEALTTDEQAMFDQPRLLIGDEGFHHD